MFISQSLKYNGIQQFEVQKCFRQTEKRHTGKKQIIQLQKPGLIMVPMEWQGALMDRRGGAIQYIEQFPFFDVTNLVTEFYEVTSNEA